jgi:predicted DNA-binding protein YlxM (UPF0122 family)
VYEEIIRLLKSYPLKKFQIEQLYFELEHPSRVGEKALIESLSIGTHPVGGAGARSGHISDRTMAIAMQYQDIMHNMNNETVSEILREIRSLEAEIQRMDLYLTFLEDKRAQVIRLHYFEVMSLSHTARELMLSKRTIIKYHKEALHQLDGMFSFIDNVKKKQE